MEPENNGHNFVGQLFQVLLAGLGNPPFDPNGSGYDLAGAFQSGDRPDATGHLGSRDMHSGMMLKGKEHKTWPEAAQAEKAAGNVITEGSNGRYYSNPPSGGQGGEEGPQKGSSGSGGGEQTTNPFMEMLEGAIGVGPGSVDRVNERLKSFPTPDQMRESVDVLGVVPLLEALSTNEGQDRIIQRTFPNIGQPDNGPAMQRQNTQQMTMDLLKLLEAGGDSQLMQQFNEHNRPGGAWQNIRALPENQVQNRSVREQLENAWAEAESLLPPPNYSGMGYYKALQADSDRNALIRDMGDPIYDRNQKKQDQLRRDRLLEDNYWRSQRDGFPNLLDRDPVTELSGIPKVHLDFRKHKEQKKSPPKKKPKKKTTKTKVRKPVRGPQADKYPKAKKKPGHGY